MYHEKNTVNNCAKILQTSSKKSPRMDSRNAKGNNQNRKRIGLKDEESMNRMKEDARELAMNKLQCRN